MRYERYGNICVFISEAARSNFHLQVSALWYCPRCWPSEKRQLSLFAIWVLDSRMFPSFFKFKYNLTSWAPHRDVFLVGSTIWVYWDHIRCLVLFLGFPGGLDGKESTCQSRRAEFNPWIGKIPRRRTWQPTPVFMPGESHGQRRLVDYSP